MLDQKHPLYVLSNLIHWETFEKEFKKHYCQNNGSMTKPIRRMVGLIILKHIRNVSDESVVEQFSENAYYQYFCGEQMFTNRPPCVPTELVQFSSQTFSRLSIVKANFPSALGLRKRSASVSERPGSNSS